RGRAEGAEPAALAVGDPERGLALEALAEAVFLAPAREPGAALLELAHGADPVLAARELGALEEVARDVVDEGIVLERGRPALGVVPVALGRLDGGLLGAVGAEPAVVVVDDPEAALLEDPAGDARLEDDELGAQAQAVDRQRLDLEALPAIAAGREVVGDLA